MQKLSNRQAILKNLILSSVCLSLCILLPFVTGQIPQIGSMLCPMHIPVLLCGFICGPWWAMGIGAIAPVLRYIIFGMPPLMPVGLSMVFELMVYGCVCGLLYRLFPKKNGYIYAGLGCSMLAGRIVLGLSCMIIYRFMNSYYTWSLFFADSFLNAIPGIVLQIILIPILVTALKKADLIS